MTNHKLMLLHFTPSMIPIPIRRWTLDNCTQAEASLNYAAVSSIIVIASTIGYQVRIKPKSNAEWKITPNLWGMIIGEPSSRKSPIVNQFIKPLQIIETESMDKYNQEITAYRELKKHYDIAQKVKDKALYKAYESADEREIAKAIQIKTPLPPTKPIQERFIINDATTEAIGEIASTSTRTLLQYRDELAGFFASFQKSGREGDRSFYLEAFQGDSSYTYDRISRGSIYIEYLSLSIFGTIQPSVLTKYILSPDAKNHDGLAQRMQLCVFNDSIIREYCDEQIDKDARNSAYSLIKELAYADYEIWGATNDQDDDIPYFRFNEEAQELFIQWYNKLKEKEREEIDLNMQAHLGKYYSLLPSLALVFFLIDKADGATTANAIEVLHFRMAEEWCRVLETHARKMYSLSDKTEITLKDKIINFVREHPEKLPATYGQLSGLIRGAKAQDVESALNNLVKTEGKLVIELLSNV